MIDDCGRKLETGGVLMNSRCCYKSERVKLFEQFVIYLLSVFTYTRIQLQYVLSNEPHQITEVGSSSSE